MRLRTLFQKKFFYTWVASYLTVLIFPIIIGTFVYFQSISIINNEVNKVHQSLLDQNKTYLDAKFEDVNKIKLEIILNQRVRSYFYRYNNISPQELYSTVEIQKDLLRYMSSNEYIDDIFIYFKNAEFMLSESYLYKNDEFELCCQRKLGISFKDFIALSQNTKFDDFRIIKSDNSNINSTDKIIVMHSAYSGGSKSTDAIVVILLDKEKLTSYVSKISNTIHGNLIILNRHGEFFGTGEFDSLPEFLKSNNFNNSNGVFQARYQNLNVAIHYTGSNVIDSKYISMIPSKIYLQKVQFIKSIILIYVAICLLLGFIIALYWSRKNYRPIDKLIKMLQKSIGKVAGNGKDEFVFLEQSLLDIIYEKDNFKSRLTQQHNVIINNFCARLLKGRIQNNMSVTSFFENYNIKFISEKFLVSVIIIDDYGKRFSFEHDDNDETLELVNFIIRNVTEELVNQKNYGIMIELDGFLVCLVNIRSEGTDDQILDNEVDDLSQMFLKMIDFIYETFGISLSVGVSNICSSVMQIDKAYSEAIETIEYMSILGDKSAVTLYSTISISDSDDFLKSSYKDEERRLLNCIIAGEYNTASQILSEIFDSNSFNNINSLKFAKCRMFGLINSLINVFGEIKCSVDIDFFNQLDPVSRIMKARSIVDLQKSVNEIFYEINLYFESNHEKSEVSAKVDEILNYIRKNYCDPNIGIKEISDYFDISVSYVSRIIKRSQGIGLLDYIHNLRIEKAKSMMKATDLSIKDIAEKVGYGSSLAMNRAFKKYEGISPAKYRNIE